MNAAVSTDSGNNPKVKFSGINGRRTLNYDAAKIASWNATIAAGSVTFASVAKRTNASSNWFFMEHGEDTASNSGCYMYEEGTGAMGLRQGGQTSFGVPNVKADWRGSSGTWYTRITRCEHPGQTYKIRINGTDLPQTNSLFQ